METATAARRQPSPGGPRGAAASCATGAPSGKMRGPMLALHGATASLPSQQAPKLETASGMALLPHPDRAPNRIRRSADEHGRKPDRKSTRLNSSHLGIS